MIDAVALVPETTVNRDVVLNSKKGIAPELLAIMMIVPIGIKANNAPRSYPLLSGPNFTCVADVNVELSKQKQPDGIELKSPGA